MKNREEIIKAVRAKRQEVFDGVMSNSELTSIIVDYAVNELKAEMEGLEDYVKQECTMYFDNSTLNWISEASLRFYYSLPWWEGVSVEDRIKDGIERGELKPNG